VLPLLAGSLIRVTDIAREFAPSSVNMTRMERDISDRREIYPELEISGIVCGAHARHYTDV